MYLALFVLGTAAGSFLNVLSLRYDPDKFIWAREVLGGRSRCPHCGKTLRWFELLPVISFILQKGRCRTCAAKLSYQYPLVEILSGLIFVLVPWYLKAQGFWIFGILSGWDLWALSAVWIAAFFVFLWIALIDIRLRIIPDELNVASLLLGGIFIWFLTEHPSFASGSFLRGYALLLDWWGASPILDHVLAAFVGLLFFGFLILLTRGRGMGVGDAKLVFALGFLFGWPDIVLVTLLSFVLGSVWGIYFILRGKKTMKSALPFGPFLVLSSAATFFFGHELLAFYFKLFPF